MKAEFSLSVFGLAFLLFCGNTAIADDKTFEIQAANGQSEELIWWEELSTCSAFYGNLHLDLKKRNNAPEKIQMTSMAMDAFLNNAKRRLEIDRAINTNAAQGIAIGQVKAEILLIASNFPLSNNNDWQKYEAELQKCDRLLSLYSMKFPNDTIR